MPFKITKEEKRLLDAVKNAEKANIARSRMSEVYSIDYADYELLRKAKANRTNETTPLLPKGKKGTQWLDLAAALARASQLEGDEEVGAEVGAGVGFQPTSAADATNSHRTIGQRIDRAWEEGGLYALRALQVVLLLAAVPEIAVAFHLLSTRPYLQCLLPAALVWLGVLMVVLAMM